MEIKDRIETSTECLMRSEEEMKTKMDALSGNDITIFDEIGVVPVKKMQSDAHVVILCLEGKGCATIEGKSYDFTKNDLFVCHPHQLIENVMISYDFKFQGLMLSPQYFQSIFYMPGKIWKAGQDVRKMPLFHLDDKEAEGFVINYKMLRYKLSLRHPVGYYADKLCITPKYLSSICKKQTGKTASDIIDEMTVNYIKQMLVSSEKSIKEIASETGFDNLSFFGKFVKRELGMSPRDYRLKS